MGYTIRTFKHFHGASHNAQPFATCYYNASTHGAEMRQIRLQNLWRCRIKVTLNRVIKKTSRVSGSAALLRRKCKHALQKEDSVNNLAHFAQTEQLQFQVARKSCLADGPIACLPSSWPRTTSKLNCNNPSFLSPRGAPEVAANKCVNNMGAKPCTISNFLFVKAQASGR